MSGPWPRFVNIDGAVANMSMDALIDELERMGRPGSSRFHGGYIKAVFKEAVRRGVMSEEEARVGVGECLAARRKIKGI